MKPVPESLSAWCSTADIETTISIAMLATFHRYLAFCCCTNVIIQCRKELRGIRLDVALVSGERAEEGHRKAPIRLCCGMMTQAKPDKQGIDTRLVFIRLRLLTSDTTSPLSTYFVNVQASRFVLPVRLHSFRQYTRKAKITLGHRRSGK
jgi:hypothetical protein